jgi:CBS domain-containing protein
MECSEIMTSEVEMVRNSDTVLEAARRMRDLDLGFLPVVDDHEQLVGVLTDRDIVLRAVAEGRAGDVAVEEVMTEEVVTCRENDDLERAEQIMRDNQKSRLVCLDEAGHVAGILSMTDILQYEDEGRAGAVAADVTEREAEVH